MQETLDLQQSESELPPRRVCVTSGGGGLGLAIARAFYAAGARVHIGEAEPQVLAEVLGDHPGMHGTVVDVSEAREVESLFSEAREWLGGLDVLVNGAANTGARAPLAELEYEDWDRTIRVNLNGMFYCLKQAARIMSAQKSGCIVNVASTAARTGLPKRSAFVAVMAGVLGLTRNAARELGPDNVRCNAILPGFVENEQGRQLVKTRARERRQPFDEAEADFLRYVSMRTWIEESEIADTVMFLASDAARHISGQSISVCGNVEWEG